MTLDSAALSARAGKAGDSSNMRDFSEAAGLDYDLLIIGGGIVGTGIARDASMRGLSVILFERDDLSSGTSSKSSRLIHGGLRYLDTYDFGLVFKDLHERERLLHLAPHLIHSLKFLILNYDPSLAQKIRLRFGMMLYDLFSSGKSLPSYEMLSAGKILEMEPALKAEGLKGGAIFYDCQATFAERISIENALSAVEHGAKIFTHSNVAGITRSGGRVTGAVVEDQFSKKSSSFRARLIINATGPWADRTMRLVEKREKDALRTTKGIHLVLPKISTNALAIYAKSDRRLLFVIPWLDYSLIGTTDTDFGDDPANARAEPVDVEYLLREISAAIRGAKYEEIRFAYAGVRPLVRSDPDKTESEVSRNYRIIDHESEKLGGMISVLGVKLTSYRAASKDVVDLVSRKLKLSTKCSTDKENLPGGRGIDNFSGFVDAQTAKLSQYGFDAKQISYLLGLYGTRIGELLSLVEREPTLKEKICPNNPDILAQIVLAVKAEYALSVCDFMMRRVPMAFSECQGLDCAETVAKQMGRLLGWSDDRIQNEVNIYRQGIDSQFAVRAPTSPTRAIGLPRRSI